MKSILAILIATTWLSGCINTLSECPPVTKIDPNVQEKASQEASKLPDDSALLKVLAAALDDRDKLRACRQITR